MPVLHFGDNDDSMSTGKRFLLHLLLQINHWLK